MAALFHLLGPSHLLQAAAAPAAEADPHLVSMCAPAGALPATTLPLRLKPGARVVFIGNALFERMQEHAWLESMLLQRFAKEELVIRTLAWPGDEIAIRPRPENYDDLFAQLTQLKTDVIIAAFGFNESFQGAAGVSGFQHQLAMFLTNLKGRHYNGRATPQIVMVSPLAAENLGAPLPDHAETNVHLRLYTEAMAQIARLCGVAFVDLFTPTAPAPASPPAIKADPLTFNGVHLTDSGYQRMAEMLYRGLLEETPPAVAPELRQTVQDKNRQSIRRFRALNAFYIYGGRAQPYGVVNFPGELNKFDEMIANRDRRAWDIAQGKAVPPKVDDSNTTPLPAITGDRPINEWLTPADELKAFKIDPRFAVNCFASEEDFPDLAKPIQMRWDTRGRLWVACSTTYPQVIPGEEPCDKLIILEDTDGDGKADRSSVFADDLHIPLSFEFGNGGVYLSEQPHLTFIKDTDGDGKADLRRIVLTGFGTEDSHHSLHDFTWTPEGDLIFRESIFHHSSVETPYGPVRARDSSFFRFHPATQRLVAFGSYYSTNPWGLTFDEWGQHLGSHPIFASAVHALNPPYPAQHVPAGDFFPAYSGTCGQEFIDSAAFPPELQGCFVRVRYKPTNVVELHRWVEKDTHYEEEKTGHIWESSNLSFIPTDVRFGPRGDLYICDWYNPVKGHMQYSLRDTRRDKTSGRIWRITAKDRPLLSPPAIAGQPIPALLALLERPEYRTRYTAKIELRERDPKQVHAALGKWMAGLDPAHPRYLHHQVEALWLHAQLGLVNAPLLTALHDSLDPHARAAATRQLRYWHPRLPDALSLLRQSANDRSGLVRLEAALAASWMQSLPAAEAALDLLQHPMDSYLTYALRTALDSMGPLWKDVPAFSAAHPELAGFLASSEPKKKRRARPEPPDPFDQLQPRVVKIGTIPERMQFTVTEFKVKPGEAVKLILENPDATQHNLVVCAPGHADEIGLAANEMAKIPGAFDLGDFVPKSPHVLHATKMLKPNETETLRFHAPTQPGAYPYVCTFPGHYLVMRGTMIVE